MKKFLVLSALFLGSLCAYSADWQWIETDIRGFNLYLDRDSIKYSGDNILYAIRYGYSGKQQKVAYIKTDATKNYIGVITSADYSPETYRPKTILLNPHVFMKPVNPDSFLFPPHRYLITVRDDKIRQAYEDVRRNETFVSFQEEKPVVKSQKPQKPQKSQVKEKEDNIFVATWKSAFVKEDSEELNAAQKRKLEEKRIALEQREANKKLKSIEKQKIKENSLTLKERIILKKLSMEEKHQAAKEARTARKQQNTVSNQPTFKERMILQKQKMVQRYQEAKERRMIQSRIDEEERQIAIKEREAIFERTAAQEQRIAQQREEAREKRLARKAQVMHKRQIIKEEKAAYKKQSEPQVSEQKETMEQKDLGITSIKDYISALRTELCSNWKPPRSGRETQAVVVIAIGSDGSLKNYKFVQSSGDADTDRSVLKALENTVPYPKFPDMGQPVSYLNFQFIFDYGKIKKTVL